MTRARIFGCALALATGIAAAQYVPPVAAGPAEKIGLYMLYPSQNKHYTTGPVVVTVVWKKGYPMPPDTRQITVQLRKQGGRSIYFRRTIGYTTAVEIDVWSRVNSSGRYYVRARSNSYLLGQWTPWRIFTTVVHVRIRPGKLYPKWKVRPPPVRRPLRRLRR